jgi:mannose-6-phosphate isomerase-like protein (cupin superfamily)
VKVVAQTSPTTTPIPGVAHATWAGHDDGLTQLSVWRQTLAAGAATPPHRHDCDEVVMCHTGSGELHTHGRVQPFAGGSTLVLPRGHVHQIINTGQQNLEITGVFAATPVATYLPDGSTLELPWRS